MHPDLERLIRLQQLDTFVESARRRIADQPARIQALDTRLDASRARVTAAQDAVAANQAARRALDKDIAAVQSRLSKFKDQLMEVKTNKEYLAMQKEIEVAQQELGRLEDRLLERLIEHDSLAAAVKEAEQALAADQAAVAEQRRALEEERERLEQELEATAGRREALVAEISRDALAIFEAVARARRGIAVAEARDGACSVCHVRLRPQKFNEVRSNSAIIQCDSCQRILYFAGP